MALEKTEWASTLIVVFWGSYSMEKHIVCPSQKIKEIKALDMVRWTIQKEKGDHQIHTKG